MGIMTFGAFIICSFERRLGRPLTAPHPMGAALPVFIDQAVAAGAHLRVLVGGVRRGLGQGPGEEIQRQREKQIEETTKRREVGDVLSYKVMSRKTK